MGIVVLLVIGLGVLIGLVVMPTVVTIVDGYPTITGNATAGEPIEAIVNLLPFSFLVLMIIGSLWALHKTL